MRRLSLLALPVVLLGAGSAAAQSSSDKEVIAVVERFFNGMRAQDTALIRSTLFSDVRLVTTATNQQGQPVVRAEGMEGFMRAISGATAKLDEKIFEPEVRIDDNLATVWTRYEFYVGDKFSHCGVDAFQMVKTAEGWKIATIADTRRRNCGK